MDAIQSSEAVKSDLKSEEEGKFSKTDLTNEHADNERYSSTSNKSWISNNPSLVDADEPELAFTKEHDWSMKPDIVSPPNVGLRTLGQGPESSGNKKKSLCEKIKSKFVKKNTVTVRNVNSEKVGKEIFQMSNIHKAPITSKGKDPKEFNELVAQTRLTILQEMEKASESKIQQDLEEYEREKHARMVEEMERKRKIERIRQEQAARGQLAGDDKLQQRYSILYYINKQQENDAMYVSTVLEELLKKDVFRESFCQFIAEEASKHSTPNSSSMSISRGSGYSTKLSPLAHGPSGLKQELLSNGHPSSRLSAVSPKVNNVKLQTPTVSPRGETNSRAGSSKSGKVSSISKQDSTLSKHNKSEPETVPKMTSKVAFSDEGKNKGNQMLDLVTERERSIASTNRKSSPTFSEVSVTKSKDHNPKNDFRYLDLV